MIQPGIYQCSIMRPEDFMVRIPVEGEIAFRCARITDLPLQFTPDSIFSSLAFDRVIILKDKSTIVVKKHGKSDRTDLIHIPSKIRARYSLALHGD
jgi:hypothetical protein